MHPQLATDAISRVAFTSNYNFIPAQNSFALQH